MVYNQNGFHNQVQTNPKIQGSNLGVGPGGARKIRPQSAKTGTQNQIGSSAPNWIQPSIP